MSPDPNAAERLKALLPLLFLVLVVALIPPLGVLLISAGVIMNWVKKAPGTWPWHGRFWDEMGWTVAGAMGITILGLVLNRLVFQAVFSVVRSWFV